MRGYVIARAQIAPISLATLSAFTPTLATAAEAPVNILFVGSSFTHGRYEPVRTYNAGFGADTVHDLLCPSLSACSGAEQGSQIDPAETPPPGTTLPAQLAYLQANPSLQYNEPDPYGGIPGIFLQFTREARLHYSVSVIAVSSATLTGYLNNTGNEEGDLPLIEGTAWDMVVLQDQSFRPLPAMITVNRKSVATRGDFAGFESGVIGLINAVDATASAAGKPSPLITLYETQSLASYGYTSTNPNAPIFGSSTSPPGGLNAPIFGSSTSPPGRLNAPYVGAPDPIGEMAMDLHDAYEQAASDYMVSNPTGSKVNVALAGDAWVSAINTRVAVRDPYLVNNPGSK